MHFLWGWMQSLFFRDNVYLFIYIFILFFFFLWIIIFLNMHLFTYSFIYLFIYLFFIYIFTYLFISFFINFLLSYLFFIKLLLVVLNAKLLIFKSSKIAKSAVFPFRTACSQLKITTKATFAVRIALNAANEINVRLALLSLSIIWQMKVGIVYYAISQVIIRRDCNVYWFVQRIAWVAKVRLRAVNAMKDTLWLMRFCVWILMDVQLVLIIIIIKFIKI